MVAQSPCPFEARLSGKGLRTPWLLGHQARSTARSGQYSHWHTPSQADQLLAGKAQPPTLHHDLLWEVRPPATLR